MTSPATVRQEQQIAGDLGFSETFIDPRLCAAIVDRLTFNGTIIEIGTTSYRLGHTRQQAIVG